MELTEPTIINVVAQPTVKEQFVQAGVGLGIAVALTVVTIGALWLAGTAMEKIQDRKNRKNPTTEK